jgi:colanic acid/amylovoran biosynthesis glycosyltransferase
MAPLRVAYILKMYPRFSETFVLSEVLELERQGVAVHIFSLKKPDDGRFHADVSRVRAGVTYVPESVLLAPGPFWRDQREVFAWDPRRYVRALARVLLRRSAHALKRFLQAGYLAPRIRRARIGHVHAHFATSATSVAYYLHELMGLSFSFTAHAKDIYADVVDPDRLALKLRTARFTVTVTDYNAAYLDRVGNAGRIVRIYNGLDLQRFALNGTPPDTPPLVLAVGRLVEKKGFTDLVRACAVLRAAGAQFRCVIVGKGPLEDALRALIHDLGLETWVTLAGPMPREALLDLYPRASVVIAPCVVAADGNRDGLPTVLIEAMALGVPVVSTPVTGIPELVEDGRTGRLVAERDPEALARAIHELLDDPARARALAKAARARIERDFDLRVNVARLRTLFEEVATP